MPAGSTHTERRIESGFTHVAPKEYRSRLLHVKGTAKSVRCSEVPFTTKSLNSGDCFVLDAGLKLFLWQGETSATDGWSAAALIVVRTALATSTGLISLLLVRGLSLRR